MTINSCLQSICEGRKDINSESTAKELASVAFETVVPCIKAYYPSFQWRESEFIVRDSKWVDLSKHLSFQPYFHDDCLHLNKRKGAKETVVFKTKQFALFVIVPEFQWGEFEAFRERCDSESTLPSQRISQPTSQYTSTSSSLFWIPIEPSLPTSMRSISQLAAVPLHPVPSAPAFLSKGQTLASASSSIFERTNIQLGPQVDKTVS